VTLGIQAPQGGLIRLTPKAALPFRRLEARLTGNADRLVVEDARFALDGSEMLGSGELRRGDGGWAGRLSLGLDALDAAAVPTIWPEGLAPQTRRAVLVAVPRGRVSDVRVTLDLEADGPWREFRLAGGGVAARLEAALIDLGPRSQVAAERLDFALRLGRESFVLDHASLTLPAPARGVAPTTISAGGEARLAGGRWRGGLNVMLDRVRLGDLPKLWPEGLGGNERPWITSNITAGEVTGGAWRIEAEAGTEFDDVTPTRVTGEATVAGATVHWLRPIPPMRGVAGRVRFGLEEIAISLRSGRQDREGEQPGSLETRDATMRILLPPGQVPSTEITIGIAGPLTETVAVLRHPRLRLFERRPFPVQVAGGTQEGVVSLAFPLVSNLATSQVRVRAETRIRNARLTRAVLDRDLEDLDLQLVTDTEQLRVSGTGSMIGVPLRLGVEMEFRPGPATQVVARESVSLRLDAVKLDELGFGAGALLAGPVALEVRTERRRNNQSTVALRGDLRDAVLSFTPLNWTKPRGTPGSAEALLRLNGDALTAIDNIRIDTQDVALRGRAIGRAGRVERIEVSESQFGGSRFVGDARAPSTGAGIWAVDLRGPVLDLRPIFGSPGQASRDRRAQREGPEGGQPPLLIDLRFDHALMGPGRDIFGLQARGRTDATA
jgi:hypothetical protein